MVDFHSEPALTSSLYCLLHLVGGHQVVVVFHNWVYWSSNAVIVKAIGADPIQVRCSFHIELLSLSESHIGTVGLSLHVRHSKVAHSQQQHLVRI